MCRNSAAAYSGGTLNAERVSPDESVVAVLRAGRYETALRT